MIDFSISVCCKLIFGDIYYDTYYAFLHNVSFPKPKLLFRLSLSLSLFFVNNFLAAATNVVAGIRETNRPVFWCQKSSQKFQILVL